VKEGGGHMFEMETAEGYFSRVEAPVLMLLSQSIALELALYAGSLLAAREYASPAVLLLVRVARCSLHCISVSQWITTNSHSHDTLPVQAHYHQSHS